MLAGDGTHLIFEPVAISPIWEEGLCSNEQEKSYWKGALVPTAGETASLISIISDSWYDTIMKRANYQGLTIFNLIMPRIADTSVSRNIMACVPPLPQTVLRASFPCL